MIRLKDVTRFFRSSLFWIPFVSIVGGALAGWGTASWYASPQFERLLNLLRERLPYATSTTPTVQIVPVESRPILPSYPSAFTSRSQAGVVSIIRRTATLGDPSARMVGSAVVLTSDGWLGTTLSAISGLRLTDLAVALDGVPHPIKQAIHDTATDLVFLKIDGANLPVAGFVRAEDVVAGTAVWLESGGGTLRPETVLSVRAREQPAAGAAEHAWRRFRVSGPSGDVWRGSAVWDGAGKLVGFNEKVDAEGWLVVPSDVAASALSSLLADGKIRRASLGVRATDLDAYLFEDERPAGLPEHGAWVHADRRGVAAVAASGPAAKLLVDGDVIERLDRDILDGSADLGERLFEYRPGATVTVSGIRKSKPFQVDITLGEIVTSESLR